MTTQAAAGTALKVLVAEDNLINQRLIVALLKELGHAAMVVNDGEKAVKCVKSIKVDAVLMDVMMPNMDGLQALAAIRAWEADTGAHLPIIMATAHDEPGEDQRYRQAGADGYLAKPIGLDRLREELRRVLPTRL